MTTPRPILTQAYMTDRRAEQFMAFGTETVLAAHAGDWGGAEELIERAEGLEWQSARTAAERHGIREFYAWVRQAHITKH